MFIFLGFHVWKDAVQVHCRPAGMSAGWKCLLDWFLAVSWSAFWNGHCRVPAAGGQSAYGSRYGSEHVCGKTESSRCVFLMSYTLLLCVILLQCVRNVLLFTNTLLWFYLIPGSREVGQNGSTAFLTSVIDLCRRSGNDWYRVYLIRKMCSQFGVEFVKKLLKSDQMSWIFPKEIQQKVRLATVWFSAYKEDKLKVLFKKFIFISLYPGWRSHTNRSVSRVWGRLQDHQKCCCKSSYGSQTGWTGWGLRGNVSSFSWWKFRIGNLNLCA